MSSKFVGWATRFCLKAVAHAVSVMQYKLQNNGFSLTEVLMAAGILAIGFAFIAGMFPVGVRLTALSTEQTIAPIVVDEAIAKIKLYGELYNELDTEPNLVDELYKAKFSFLPAYSNGYVDFSDVVQTYVPSAEFEYPSTPVAVTDQKKYHWSALCGLLPDGNVHVIVFVSRKAGAGAQYLNHNFDYELANYGQANPSDPCDWPLPVRVGVEVSEDEQRLTIDSDSPQRSYISTGSTIVDDATGRIYRVLERVPDDVNGTIVIVLDRDWEWEVPVVLPEPVSVWVVPPAVTSTSPTVRVGGRYPCVRVDPAHTIRF